MDFEVPAELKELAQRVRRFVDEEVIPLEPLEKDEEGLPAERLEGLRRRAREVGIWGPQLPREYGGLGLETLGMCVVFEEAGRSTLGALKKMRT